MIGSTIVLDASPLIHFARAHELSALADLLKGFECVTTRAVLDELGDGVERYPELDGALGADWISTVACDSLPVLYLFGQYLAQLGNPLRNGGEASVLAWAEHNGAVAYVDDQVASTWGAGVGCGFTALLT